MDLGLTAPALAWILLGASAGVVTGLVPGLHVNTLAALGLAIAPMSGAATAWFLVAAGTAHSFVHILPSVYLGAPDDAGWTVLPAHRMLMEGRGADAVAVSVHASLVACVAALAFFPLYGKALTGPGDIAGSVTEWMPWIVAAVVLTLWLQEAANGVQALLAAVAVSLGSGALAMMAENAPLRGLVAVPTGPLLPLLGGLFGGATLIGALGGPAVIPLQRPPSSSRRALHAVPGLFASMFTAVVPGVTAAVAAALVPARGSTDPKRIIALTSAISTAHSVLALHVLLWMGDVRSGLARAVSQRAQGTTWSAAGPGEGAVVLVTAVGLGGLVGAAATHAIGAALRPWIHHAPARGLAGVGLLCLVAAVVVLTGPGGLLVFAASVALGRVPVAAGIRRVHLTGCLTWPILISRFAGH